MPVRTVVRDGHQLFTMFRNACTRRSCRAGVVGIASLTARDSMICRAERRDGRVDSAVTTAVCSGIDLPLPKQCRKLGSGAAPRSLRSVIAQ